jgi:SWI/SNF-related matrix-associated actin-dependent regulator 1 of chromatin subfamily A
VILEVGETLEPKTRTFSTVHEGATRRAAELLAAEFVSADPDRTAAPASAHVRLLPGEWAERASRLSAPEWCVWDLPSWLQALFATRSAFAWTCSPEYESTVWSTLYPHQQAAVRVGVQHNGSLFLADGMGLGKTRAALALAAYYRPPSLLVVSPAALRSNWVHEARAWFPELASVTKGTALAVEAPRFAVVSYALLPKLDQPYEFYIFDESHYLKNAHAARTRAALRLVERCAARVVLLSGTPLSRNADLYAQLRVLGALPAQCPFFPFQSRYSKNAAPADYFAYRYTLPEVVYTPREVVRFQRNRRAWELGALLAATATVRRTKADVGGLELPPKVRDTCVVGTLPAAQRAHFERELSRSSATSLPRPDAHLLGLVLRTAKLKLGYTLAFVREMLSAAWQSDKVLLFAHYHATLDALAAVCRDLGVQHVQVDGRCSAAEKDERVERFRADAHVRCAVLGLQCAGVGLNLPNANRVVFTELGWNPDDYLQAEDRAHRIGCTQPVRVLYLLLPHSTDDVMYRTLSAKHGNSARVLDQVASSEAAPTSAFLPRKRVRDNGTY